MRGAPLAWSPDGAPAALVFFDSNGFPSIRVIEVAKGTLLWSIQLPLANRQLAAALSPDNNSLAISIAVPIVVCLLTLGIWIMRRRRWR